MSKKKIRIVIIEDSSIHREWLNLELESDFFIDIICAESQGRKGLDEVKLNQPDLVVLDFQLKDVTGLEVARRIKCFESKIKVFCITAHTEVSIIERLISNKHLDGIAIKGSPYFESNLSAAIRSVASGGSYIDPTLLDKLRQFKKVEPLGQLTKQEFEVFIQTRLNRSDDEIAKDLSVSVNHIKNTKSHILNKLKKSDLNGVLASLVDNRNPEPIH